MTNNHSKHGSDDTALPRGYIRLQGTRNYDKWAFTCQAKWSELGTDYVLTSNDPRKEDSVRSMQAQVVGIPWSMQAYVVGIPALMSG